MVGTFRDAAIAAMRLKSNENAAYSMSARGMGTMRGHFPRAAAGGLLSKERPYSLLFEQQRVMPMATQTELPQKPPVSPEAEPKSRPPASTKEATVAGPTVYWGDRLTLKFWLFCFGLMFAMNLVEALHRLVLFLMGRSPAP